MDEKKWARSRDWLDKASEPSELSTKDHLGLWVMVALAVVAVGCGLLFFGRLIF